MLLSRRCLWTCGPLLRSASRSKRKVRSGDRRPTFPRRQDKDEVEVTFEDERTRELKDVISSTKESFEKRMAEMTFYDPDNKTLNLRLDNSELYDGIFAGCQSRMTKRYNTALIEWRKNLFRLIRELKLQEDNILESFEKLVTQGNICAESCTAPPKVGDLVLLREDSTELFIIARTPLNLETAGSYAFIGANGEIVFGSKNMIRLRLPGIIPQKYSPIVESFVQLERKHLDVAPVGINDNLFSRSPDSLPAELKDDSEAKASTSQDSETTETDSFVVTQASSQLFINSNINTYYVPLLARKLYVPSLRKLQLRITEKLNEYDRKLNGLYYNLQKTLNGDDLNSSKSVSVFYLLSKLDETSKLREKTHPPQAISTISSNQLGKSSLIEAHASSQSFPISSYVALLMALKKQTSHWFFTKQSSVYPVTSVVVTANTSTIHISKVMRKLKHDATLNQFVEYFNASPKPSEKPECFNDVIGLLKTYVGGNLDNDLEFQYFINNIIRKCKSLAKDVEFIYEYSKARAYDIICELEDEQINENPVKWSNAVRGPSKGYAQVVEDEYFTYLDHLDIDSLRSSTPKQSKAAEKKLDTFDEHIEGNPTIKLEDITFEERVSRTDYGNSPVYCIDNPTAHEIDDGIGIMEDDSNSNYVLCVHVANPSLYINKSSDLSLIAFNKGQTSYFPEGAELMFPDIVNNLSGLGRDGVDTRTFVVRFEIPKLFLDDYIKQLRDDPQYQPSPQQLDEMSAFVDRTGVVDLGIAKNFPQGYTYDKVNVVLAQIPHDTHFDNLNKLYHVALLMRAHRYHVGNPIDMASTSANVSVSSTPSKNQNVSVVDTSSERGFAIDTGNNSIRVIANLAQLEDAKAQLLVSEFMISANYILSMYAAKKNVPVVYRNQELNVTAEMQKEMNQMLQRGFKDLIGTPELTRLYAVMTPARLSTKRKGHLALGLSGYTTVTSPLRRFADMINQWSWLQWFTRLRLHEVQKVHLKDDLVLIVNTLSGRDMLNKHIQNRSSVFWEGIFLTTYCGMLAKGIVNEPIFFKVMIRERVKSNTYRAEAVGLLGSLDTYLETSNVYHTGDYVYTWKIKTVDPIENALVFVEEA